VINRLQEALEGTRDRESHLAERVAASVADGHRSPHAFLHSFYGSSFTRTVGASTDREPVAMLLECGEALFERIEQ